MHENAPVLKGKLRERVGSRYARRSRAAGGLPAVVYGHRQEPVAVTLQAHEALLYFKKGERVFTLEVEGQGAETVLLRDLQFDHLGTNIVHADLARVDLDERVHANVAIHIVGEGDCKALKLSGTTLMHPVSSLDIECAVSNLPDYIEVDVRDLEPNGTIHAKDVALPLDTMKLLTDPEAVVAHIVFVAREEESAEGASVAGGAAPQVTTERKGEG